VLDGGLLVHLAIVAQYPLSFASPLVET